MTMNVTVIMKKLPLFFYIATYGSLLFTLIVVIEERGELNWYAYTAALIVIAVFSVAATYVGTSYFKSAISSEGIYGFNCFGKRKYIEWNEVASVKPSNLCGLRYLRVFSRKSKLAIWLPLNIKNAHELVNALRALAPENNLLSEYLVKNG